MKKIFAIFFAVVALTTQAGTQLITLPDANLIPSDFDLEGGFHPSPEVNVLKYGADTNGVVDARAAFVAAMAALPRGGILRVPRGTYKFATAWTLAKSDYTVIGEGAKLKYVPAARTGNFLILQGSRFKWRGIDFDGNTNCVQVVYIDNATGGAGANSIRGNTFEGAYADDTNDPAQTSDATLLAIRRGNQFWEIFGNVFTNSTCVVAGTRTTSAISITDLGYTTSADANLGGLIENNWFSQILPGGNGDAIRIILTQNYDSGIKILNNNFGDGIGFRSIKIIGNGCIVKGNFMHGTDANARAGISDYGDNNVIEGNHIVGLYTYGIEGGSSLGFTVRNGMYLGNHIRFEGAAITTGIGLRFLFNVMNAQIANNSITDASRAVLADGKFYGNSILGTRATNIVNNAIELNSDGSNAPWNCLVDDTLVVSGGSNGVSFGAGTNLFCGVVMGSPAALINRASGVSGGRLVTTRGDGVMVDWNGDPILSNYPIADDCISVTLAGAIGWTSSTANSGTAAVSSILDANHSGVYAVSNGGTTNGVGNIRTAGNNMLLGTRTVRLIGCVKTPPLSSVVDRYQIFFGFGDATTAASVDGAFFTYSDNLNSGNWTGQTMSGSSTTTASGGSNVAVTGNAYWWLGVEGNSTSCKFYVAADASGAPGAWTLIGSSSATLPTAGATGLLHMIIKQAGSTGTTTETFYMEKVFYQP
jgi:hypothetical protein